MKSIRWVLFRSVLLVIAVLSATSMGIFIMHLVVVENYRAISDNLVAEYRLMDTTSSLISEYNTRYRDWDKTISEQRIREINDQISDLIDFLDKRIVNKDSMVSYIGFKNTIGDIEQVIDHGLEALNSGQMSDIVSYYDEANRKYAFVRDNGTQLILSELKYAETLQKRMMKIYSMSAVLALGVLLSVVAGCVTYYFSFSKKITTPIAQLKEISEQIIQGHTEVKIDKELTKRSDEIGSMSRSYQVMLDKLLDNLKKLTVSSQKLTSVNRDLEEMNSLMVGREIKMIELKDRIKQLEKQSNSSQSGS